MFVIWALSSRWWSFIHLLQLHFTLLLFGLLLFTFSLILSCFSPCRDSCMLIHWITQLTHFFACFLSSSCGCGKSCCRLVLLALVLLGSEPAPNCTFSECCCSIAGKHLLQLQEQHIHKSDKQLNNWRTSIFCWDSALKFAPRYISHMLLYADSSLTTTSNRTSSVRTFEFRNPGIGSQNMTKIRNGKLQN